MSLSGDEIQGNSGKEMADSAYINGKIYTVDNDRIWAEAVAIRDGHFVAVGSNEEIQEYVGTETKVDDLKGRMVMPGIYDAHTHLYLGGVRFFLECVLTDPTTPEQIVKDLKEYEKKNGTHEGWLTGGAFNPMFFPETKPKKELLDEAFPETPVYLMQYDIHHGLINSKGMELLGINKDTPDPFGGKFIRDEATGEPTGYLAEEANWLTKSRLPGYSVSQYIDMLKWTFSICNRYGIVSVQEAGAPEAILGMLKLLDSFGELTLSVHAHLLWRPGSGDIPWFIFGTEKDQKELIKRRKNYESNNVFVDYAKVFMDGAPLPPDFSHAPLDPVTGEIDQTNLFLSEEQLTGFITWLDKQGVYQVKIHAAGEGSARATLNAIEKANKIVKHPFKYEMAHAQSTHPDDLPRFKELGVIAEYSPEIWSSKEEVFSEIVKLFRYKSMIETGALVTAGSDWLLPPTPNLFPGIGGMLDLGAESVDLPTAIEILTINGARAVGRENVEGSIEPGKKSNMIVLDRNLFEVTPEQIQGTKVLRTIFSGKVVYKDN